MKKIVVLLLLMISVFAVTTSSMAQEKKEIKKKKNTETLTYWASIDCEACKAKVEKNIAFEKGVKDLNVDLKTKLITVTYRSDKTNPEKLEKAIQDLGFKTELIPEKKEKEKAKKK